MKRRETPKRRRKRTNEAWQDEAVFAFKILRNADVGRRIQRSGPRTFDRNLNAAAALASNGTSSSRGTSNDPMRLVGAPFRKVATVRPRGTIPEMLLVRCLRAIALPDANKPRRAADRAATIQPVLRKLRGRTRGRAGRSAARSCRRRRRDWRRSARCPADPRDRTRKDEVPVPLADSSPVRRSTSTARNGHRWRSSP